MEHVAKRPAAQGKNDPAKGAGAPGGFTPKGPSAKETSWNRLPSLLQS